MDNNRHHGSPRQYGQKLPAVACVLKKIAALAIECSKGLK
jgi:hypothetical protein